MESKAYEIYRNAVGGITFNGDKMKELDELPKKIQDAWKTISKFRGNDFERCNNYNKYIAYCLCDSEQDEYSKCSRAEMHAQ